MSTKFFACLATVFLALACGTANATIRITEWMYNGEAEFVELSNIGSFAIDLNGWSMDDENATPGAFDLSPLGSVAPGESVIITESTADAFRTDWGLSSSVKVLDELGVSTGNNFGRGDEINVYDSTNAPVDQLTYGDEDIPGTIRTNEFSGNPLSPTVLGTNDVANWVLSSVGDAYGSYQATSGDVGNPGTYVVPEPASVLLLLAGAGLMVAYRHYLVCS